MVARAIQLCEIWRQTFEGRDSLSLTDKFIEVTPHEQAQGTTLKSVTSNLSALRTAKWQDIFQNATSDYHL